MSLVRWGVSQRFAALFAVVLLTLVALTVEVARHVDSMHLSIERLAEEQRETDSAMYLLHHVRMLDLHARKMNAAQWGERTEQFEELRFHAAQARQVLDELSHGPHGTDPSSPDHAEDEARLYGALESGLNALEAELDDSVEPSQAIADIAELLRSAEVLNEEVHEEELRASAALFDEATDVRTAVIGAACVALVVLVVALLLVKRSVVAPLLELRQGAGRIAAGELSHRVSVRADHEVGELAAEFNRMAAELAAMHAELEQRVEQRTREFVRAARLAGLGTMAAGIAHEINNPLASIASCAEGLERRLRAGAADRDEQLEYLAIIAKEAFRAHEITSRLLEFARSEPGPSVAYRPIDVVRGLDVLLRHRLREQSLDMRVECDESLPSVRGRPSECRQVVLNLIHNAIDASPRGASIFVRGRVEPDAVVFEVEDQGPGIAPELSERVFDPFFTTKPPGQGTGLGLSIVERIVTSQGGRVEARNTGAGALFRVRLPLESERAA